MQVESLAINLPTECISDIKFNPNLNNRGLGFVTEKWVTDRALMTIPTRRSLASILASGFYGIVHRRSSEIFPVVVKTNEEHTRAFEVGEHLCVIEGSGVVVPRMMITAKGVGATGKRYEAQTSEPFNRLLFGEEEPIGLFGHVDAQAEMDLSERAIQAGYPAAFVLANIELDTNRTTRFLDMMWKGSKHKNEMLRQIEILSSNRSAANSGFDKMAICLRLTGLNIDLDDEFDEGRFEHFLKGMRDVFPDFLKKIGDVQGRNFWQDYIPYIYSLRTGVPSKIHREMDYDYLGLARDHEFHKDLAPIWKYELYSRDGANYAITKYRNSILEVL